MLKLINVSSIVSNTTSQLTPTAPPSPTESLNITTQQTTQIEILRLLREMQTDFRTQRGGNNRGNPGGGRGTQGRNDNVGGEVVLAVEIGQTRKLQMLPLLHEVSPTNTAGSMVLATTLPENVIEKQMGIKKMRRSRIRQEDQMHIVNDSWSWVNILKTHY